MESIFNFSTIIDRHREAAVEINSALNNIFNPEASEEQTASELDALASELDALLNDLF